MKKQIMGILNITPDSFFDGGKFFDIDSAFSQAVRMKEEGADIIDIGGESTRPGADPVSADKELSRILPIVKKIKSEIDIKISIDTTKSEVAEECLKEGAHMINDVSGLLFDNKMAKVVADFDAEIVIMHIKGNPQNMQQNTEYNDLIDEIKTSLKSSVKKAEKAGISKDKIIIDPGIGFGKSVEQNYTIINKVYEFKQLDFPVLIGLSNKSLIWKVYDNKTIDRLPATIALNMISIYNGADIIRVHNVREHRLALDTMEILLENIQ